MGIQASTEDGIGLFRRGCHRITLLSCTRAAAALGTSLQPSCLPFFVELAYFPFQIDVAATGAPRSDFTLAVGHLGARTRESQGSKLGTINNGE